MIALFLCVIQKRFSIKLYSKKKNTLHLLHLGFNAKLQNPAIIWNIAAKGRGGEKAQMQKQEQEKSGGIRTKCRNALLDGDGF